MLHRETASPLHRRAREKVTGCCRHMTLEPQEHRTLPTQPQLDMNHSRTTRIEDFEPTDGIHYGTAAS